MNKAGSVIASDPYLGRQALYALDLFIPIFLKTNQEIADWTKTHKGSMTTLQNACCYIFPNAVQISLSIRELLRSGYLFSAKILLRALVERALVISTFQKQPEKIARWLKGGSRSRPIYPEMIGCMDEFETFSLNEGIDMKALFKSYVDDLHSVVHTDLIGLHQNTLFTQEGEIRFLSGADHNNPKLADEVCQQTLIFMTLLFKRMHEIFPSATTSAQ